MRGLFIHAAWTVLALVVGCAVGLPFVAWSGSGLVGGFIGLIVALRIYYLCPDCKKGKANV